jgi:DNA-directed RNA polymerase specialized sigma24 family protein
MTDPTDDMKRRAREALERSLQLPSGPHGPVHPDEVARIDRAITTLRPMDRAVFLACRLDGQSYPEIAHEMGISVAQVERAIFRSLRRISRELDRPPRRWRFWPF